MIVEHFSHFPQVYPTSTYDAETLATVLFKHFCTFGVFHQLASDPGSAMMAEVVKQLNTWLGVSHKVSLVGRHESNGCEGSIKQFLRHLRTLVYDERLVNNWSSDTVLPLINFALCSYPSSETGGFTPFQLKYGTEDAAYFKLPDSPPDSKAAALIKILDANLRIVRSKSLELQKVIVDERRKKDGEPQSYVPGDLVLFNQREKPTDMLPSKLSPPFLGPYRVISQSKNDVDCEHVVTYEKKLLHVSRLKPFFGSNDDAFRIGQLDRDQYVITKINFFTGNPHIRNSMMFSVTFEGGDTVLLPYTQDLATSEPFILFANSRPWLQPLCYSAAEFKKHFASVNRQPITSFRPGDRGLLHLRYYDSINLSWYDKLELPDQNTEYVVAIDFDSWVNSKHTRITAKCRLFNSTVILQPYEVSAYVTDIYNADKYSMHVVTEDDNDIYEKLLPWVQV